jgi:maltose alpha-D-glucosyltransferase/alpha-amylase
MGDISMAVKTGEKTTVAMLQGLVANVGDGWEWFLRQLQAFYGSASAASAPPAVPTPGFANAAKCPDEVRTLSSSTMEAAALLGRRTAEMHLALSCSSHDPAFAPEPCRKQDLDTDAGQIEGQIRSALETLKSRFSTLDETTSDAAGLLLSRRRELLDRNHSISEIQAGGQRIRIHGDYHLGQTLRTEANHGEQTGISSGDFVLLDFEGEPARPLAQRRRKQSPLRDVAGMLRSFSYAAYAGLKQHMETHPESADRVKSKGLAEWAHAWQRCASSEFLRAYRETIATRPELLPSADDTQKLLDAYVLEKALYELLYEMNNRPAWIHIPIAGILSL